MERMINWKWGAFLAVCLGALTVSARAQETVLLPAQGTWQFKKGTAEASSPKLSWTERSFRPQAAWPLGQAPFFYDANGQYQGGQEFSDMRGNYTSIYMRRPFLVQELEKAGLLELRARCDDGFVAWINGVEVVRHNVPFGELSYNSTAQGAAQEPLQDLVFGLSNAEGHLVEGVNVLAVQLFNTSLSSSDLFFEVSLVSKPAPTPEPPVIVRVQPAAGTVAELQQVTVTFSEPVLGVDALDLLLNDRSPIGVSGAGAVYTFDLPNLEEGDIRVRFDPGHGIIDLNSPPSSFDATKGDHEWSYKLVDNLPPTVSGLQPVAGSGVERLERVAVSFDQPVQGVDKDDLRMGSEVALSVKGIGAGPYVFEFPLREEEGEVEMSWASGHGIQDLADPPNAFGGGAWSYQVGNGGALAGIRLNELVASNQEGLQDEDGETPDWIEIYNGGDQAVSLLGWALTDNKDAAAPWFFPDVELAAGAYLVVFASGKDRRDPGGAFLHSDFKLSAAGEYLALLAPGLPQPVADEIEFGEQRANHAYGRAASGEWAYFRSPSPNRINSSTPLLGISGPVRFSAERGFYRTLFQVHLSTDSPEAVIRYTTDGSEPTWTQGTVYEGPIWVIRASLLRAAAFEPNKLPSRVATHSYLFTTPAVYSLPAISLVTDRSNLWGATGIMETNPRNTTKRGIAWERPVSMEWITLDRKDDFQVDAGLRVQGGNYVRQRYDPRGSLPFSKYSFRLYFRGDYGVKELDFPMFPDSAVTAFDKIVLRAGMNDHSNPFIGDELVRRLSADTGQVASLGEIVALFLNGAYKGYYNPTERIDDEFLRAWHGGTNEWDLIAQFGEIREGDGVAWNDLLNKAARYNLAEEAAFLQVAERMDLVNFIDYLLVNVYVATGDWPHNNWRAARERVPGAKFRFYVWDAEWSFGYRNGVQHNTFNNELSQNNADIATLYQNLRQNAEFRLMFADRVQKHFYDGGALTEENVLRRYRELRDRMKSVLPNMNDTVERVWVPQRRGYIMEHMQRAGLLSRVAAPRFSRPSGPVPEGFPLVVSASGGTIYMTTDGQDPRVRLTGAVSASAVATPSGTTLELEGDTRFKARVLQGDDWSALVEATFDVARVGTPLRVTELMYHPQGGEQFEFVELHNTSAQSVALGGMRFEGVEFAFEPGTEMPGGATWVFIPNDQPDAFMSRYPGVRVAGMYRGSLRNGGETLRLLDMSGRPVLALAYDDENGWPPAADGAGYSLELTDLRQDPASPAAWTRSAAVGGSPGQFAILARATVRLSEVMADNRTAVEHGGHFPDWVELWNRGTKTADMSGWSLSDRGQVGQFFFPAGSKLEPGERAVVWCDGRTELPGWHADFALDREGESVFLYDEQGRRVDAVSFGRQINDSSLAWIEGGWTLGIPTPGLENSAAPLADQAAARINEWLADSVPGERDWVELFNSDFEKPMQVTGLRLECNESQAHFYELSFLPAGGHGRWWAAGEPGSGQLPFKLPSEGAELLLSDQLGRRVDTVRYDAQLEGVSEGRLPDGGSSVVSFSLNPTPGAPNGQAVYEGPALHEILVWPDDGGSGWVELHNPSAQLIDLSGSGLGVVRNPEERWIFPVGAAIEPGDYLRVDFNPAGGGEESLNSYLAMNRNGGAVYLFDQGGTIVEERLFGFQVPGRSIGETGGGWALLAEVTPGGPNSGPALLGNRERVKINEWQVAADGTPDWIEIFNREDLPVDLGGLYLSDDATVAGLVQFKIRPLTFVDGRGYVVWIADGQAEKGANHLNFKLSRFGESIRLSHPPMQSLTRPVDYIDFGVVGTEASTGRLPDGGEEIVPFEVRATPGGPNGGVPADADGDGIPDEWELTVGLDIGRDDAAEDPDADDLSNFAEYLAGTDPKDAGSVWGVTVSLAEGELVLQFTVLAGRQYKLVSAAGLPAAWEGLAEWEPSSDGMLEHRVELDPGMSLRLFQVQIEPVPGELAR